MKSDTILISIHPVYVDKILSGRKKYEFRKRFPEGVRYMLVYTTSPVKKITVLVEIAYVIKDSPNNIWRKTSKDAGVTRKFFEAYFKNKTNAYAVRFKEIHKLEKPLSITDIKGVKAAPQSYIYIKNTISNMVNYIR